MKRTVESRTNIALKVFMASLSAAVREEHTLQPEPTGKPDVIACDHWIDMRWVKKFYAWNDAEGSHSIDVSDQYRQDGSRIW